MTATTEVGGVSIEGLTERLDEAWSAGPCRRHDGQPLTKLMDSPFDQESATDNPYWEVVRRLALSYHYSLGGHATEVDWTELPRSVGPVRSLTTRNYAWSIPSPSDLTWIASWLGGRSVVEVGAGTGYWAWQLSQVGVQVEAYDISPGGNHWVGEASYHDVRSMRYASDLDFGDSALMLCWPPCGTSMAADALAAYPGDFLIYIGEQGGGCCADDAFFEATDRDWTHLGDSPNHVTYWGIQCYVSAYTRRTPRSDMDMRVLTQHAEMAEAVAQVNANAQEAQR